MEEYRVEKFLKRKLFKGLKVSQEQKEEVEKVILNFGHKGVGKHLNRIKCLLEAKFSPNWVDKIKEVQIVTSNNLKGYQILYGEEDGLRRFEIKKQKASGSLQTYITKFGEVKGRKKYESACKSKKGQSTEQWYINKFGEEGGKKKWQEIKHKWRESNLKTLREGRYKGNGRTLKEYVQRHGEKLGEKLWEERNKTQSYKTSKKYYIDRFGETEGTKRSREYKDHGSIKYFTTKYGEQEGKKRYEEKCKLSDWGGMGLNNLILKYGKKEGTRKQKEWLNKCMLNKNKSIHYSKISQELFWEVYKNLTDDLKLKVKFAELNCEQMFKIWKYGLTVIFVDFKLENIIIEFQGSYWHRSPEVKEKDERRLKALKECGYKVLYVEQNDYEANELKTINDCVSFINANYEERRKRYI